MTEYRIPFNRAAVVGNEQAYMAEAVASFVDAQRVRDEVLKICETVLQIEKLSTDDRYWLLATAAEAYLGLGDEGRAAETLKQAFSIASSKSSAWSR